MTRNKKGQFVKGSRALTRTRTKYVTKTRTRNVVRARRSRRRSGGRSAGGITATRLAGAGIAMGWLLGDKTATTPSFAVPVRTFFASTIPGGKTFGPFATAGAVAYAVDRFVYKSPWLRAAAVVGLSVAALQLGQQNTAFKFLGDSHGDSDDIIADVD